MQIKKPMLAEKVTDVALLKFPLIATPKLDGIRAFISGGKLLSRTGKPIRNDHIRTTLEAILPEGADGEIMLPGSFQDVTSGVMAAKGTPEFTYHMFDIASERPYSVRLVDVVATIDSLPPNSPILLVPFKLINNLVELAEFESEVLARGCEGVILRHPLGPYKQGRSTFKEHFLLKLKRFEDSEAEVIGFTEMMHNENKEQRNEVGYMDRSTAKDGMVPASTLGTFIVRDVHTGVEFEIGTGKGLTALLRQIIWDNRESYLGQTIKYQHFPIGAKDKPRLPSFQGFRDKEDFTV